MHRMVAQCSSVGYSGSDGRYDTGRDALQILGPCRDRAGRVTEWNSSPLRCLWEFAIPTGGTWGRGAADVPRDALTPNPLYGHYKVVEVALLGHGRPRVPVVLEEDGVDAILAEASEPIESCLLGLQVVVDPELENAVGQPGVVQPRVRLHAIPLAYMARVEKRGHARLPSEPVEVREIVVPRGLEVPQRIGAGHGVQLESVRVGRIAAPQMGNHGLHPLGRHNAACPCEFVACAAHPPRRIPDVHPPVHLPVDRRPRVHRPEVASGHPPHGEAQRARRAPPPSDPPPPAVGAVPTCPFHPHKCAIGVVVLEALAPPILLEVVTPDPPPPWRRTLVDTRGSRERDHGATVPLARRGEGGRAHWDRRDDAA